MLERNKYARHKRYECKHKDIGYVYGYQLIYNESTGFKSAVRARDCTAHSDNIRAAAVVVVHMVDDIVLAQPSIWAQP